MKRGLAPERRAVCRSGACSRPGAGDRLRNGGRACRCGACPLTPVRPFPRKVRQPACLFARAAPTPPASRGRGDGTGRIGNRGRGGRCGAEAPPQPPPPPTAADRADRAVAAAAGYLLEQIGKDGQAAGEPQAQDPRFGGRTALCVQAILTAGVEPNKNDTLARAVDWLRKAQLHGHLRGGPGAYAAGLLKEPQYYELLCKDAAWLIQAANNEGGYTYASSGGQPPGDSQDNSNAQMALLGVWSAAQEAWRCRWPTEPRRAVLAQPAAARRRLGYRADAITSAPRATGP